MTLTLTLTLTLATCSRALHRIALRNMPPSEIETELPKAHVKRLVKATLHEMIGDAPGSREFSMSKDALLAFSEAGKIFVHYLTATANDLCKEGKRQTISAKDVFTALKDLEFDEFTQPLKEAVESRSSRSCSAEAQTGKCWMRYGCCFASYFLTLIPDAVTIRLPQG